MGKSPGGFWRFISGGLLLVPVGWLVALAGAEGPAKSRTPDFSKEERAHWAYQPVVRPQVPRVKDSGRLRTPLDAFLLQRLEDKGLSFLAPAAKATLMRRASLDLTGLPPAPGEIEEFLADDAPDAYERLIDRLLASPHYGEAWGRDWLDLVRFAETAGYNADPLRPLAWKFRDYVLRAFNADIPYDRFLREQIAGDELFPGEHDALVATGYNRMWPDESNASDVLLARQDALNDLTANVGSVFLGLSLGCAQCHDHKFDPLLQRDFYSLQAFFSGIVPLDHVPLGSAAQLAEYHQKLEHWLAETAQVRDQLHAIEQTARAAAGRERRKRFQPVVLDAIDTAPESRTALQHQFVFWSERQIMLTEKDCLAQMTGVQKLRVTELQKRLKELEAGRPRPPAEADIMATVDVPGEQPKTHLLAGGSYTKPREELSPAFVTILNSRIGASAPVAGIASATGVPPAAGVPTAPRRRADLANWLADSRHPLVPRVIVNRLWQGHFARGLVENANDFGTQTPPPTHPELLDWLASEFVARGFSIKAMHRLIMTSEAYRQSAYHRRETETAPAAAEIDPDNRLYWHFPRKRLSSERIRDAMLAVSGRLSTRMEGPGVRVPLPAALGKRDSWKVTEQPAEHGRRSVYIFAKRNLPYPLLQAFDLPDMHESCPRRAATTTAPQALFLLNSDDTLSCANAFADRVTHESGTNRVERAYLLAFGRPPGAAERSEAAAFLESQGRQSGPRAALVDFCHALLNSNEFLFVE